MNPDIYNEARIHFFESGQKFEYGRPNHVYHSKINGRSDPSRTEQDLDGDGKRGVDCSSFVWRGLHDAGYNVAKEPFGTSDLFNGHQTTAYAKSHFDVISANDARKPHGNLQPGDIIMFKEKGGTGQHVGIVRDYDSHGNIRFIGSQVGTGPGEVTIQPGRYWDGDKMEIMGALRAKPEFQTKAPLHGGQAPHDKAQEPATPKQPGTSAKPEAHTPPDHKAATLHPGDKGADVQRLQERLNALGVTDANGKRLDTDSHFGQHTKEAVERFQREHKLDPDGVVGKKTLDAIEAAEKLRAHGPRMDSPEHPDHKLYEQARKAVERLDAQHGHVWDERSERVAGLTTLTAKQHGMTSIDHVVTNQDATKAYAVQGDLNSPFKQTAEVDMQKALATPLDKSSEMAAQHHATQQGQHVEQAQQAQQQQTQQQQQR
ncbi:MAG: hypothetical protein GAK28_04656 [Luteibacter sp.]|uniref:XVIPCD domain-containing protein n=1 Tax=Luteibacter sp. TaxID=1886636 RepID=UPI0013826A51|nr:XVIPCD domain-containing protein [Luteibacter sp.]KAF1003520.1 MAG: hypothetical protein GAK28_04656 [Luteibacter sp.]